MKPYFDNINERIIDELNKAEHEISIAVAWITDNKIIDTLIWKAVQGVKIEILISFRTFNEKHKEMQVKNIQRMSMPNCRIYKIGSEADFSPIMHHKFCVIDNHILITGSFNWTNQAKRNYEDIIINDNYEIAQQYIDRFNELKKKISKERLWFNQLDYVWQQVFKNAIGIENDPTKDELEKIANLSKLDISAAPLTLRQDWEEELFKELIQGEENLSELDIEIYKLIAHNEYEVVNDLSPVSFMKNLRILNCSGTDIKTLEPINGLKDLEVLDASYTLIKDLTPLHDKKKLKEINIYETLVTKAEIEKLETNNPDYFSAKTERKEIDYNDKVPF